MSMRDEFYAKLEQLNDEAKGRYRGCGELYGLFKLSSTEAKRTTLEQKRECVRQMVAGGIPLPLIRAAAISKMVSRGLSENEALMHFDDQMARFMMSPTQIENLRAWLPDFGI